jgi:acyl-CoA dehydrogenase
MLPREFTEEQEMFRQAYRKFLSAERVPHMESWRAAGIVDRSAFRKAGERGFLMVWPEERFGGSGDADFRFEQIITEETQYARCGDWFNSLHSRLVGPYITRFGTAEQQERFMPGCVAGDTILAVAMTEPDAGSDLAGMRTHAVDHGDHWLLNGSKTYISNGINADLVVVAAKTDPANNPHHMTLFLVERGMEGFTRGRNLVKMGMKAQDTAELFFADVKVPKQNVLGEAGKGFYYLMEGLAEERLLGGCSYLAAAQLSFDITAAWVKERRAFGKRLSDFQNTQFKLAEMDSEVSAMRVFIDRCIELHLQGKLDIPTAAKTKLLSTDLQCKVIDECVQLHGGYGYMWEYPIARAWADSRVQRIYAGTNEVMKVIISRALLG